MAKDGKTEKATPKRRQDSRKKGQVLKSKELNNFMSFCTLFIGVLFFGSNVITVFYKVMQTGLDQISLNATPTHLLKETLSEGLPLLLGTFCFYLASVLISTFAQSGFLFSVEAIKPNFKKMNPANYFKNVFDFKKSGFELLKNFLVFGIVMAVLYNVYINNKNTFQELLLTSWTESIFKFQDIFNEMLIKLGVVFLVVAIADYFFHKSQYEDSLKMKKQELKDEQKDQNGNPEIKYRQRQMFKRMLEKQIKKKIPDASVVIVNPTHYAVAIRYKTHKGDQLPKVVVKGIDNVALYIKEQAREHNIPIVENIPLARKMYAEIKEEEYISEELFDVVGKIIRKLVDDKKIKIDRD